MQARTAHSLNFQQRNSNAECDIVPLKTIIKEKVILRNKSVELCYSYSLREASENGFTGCGSFHCVRLGLKKHREHDKHKYDGDD